jgi:glutathione S-transferase
MAILYRCKTPTDWLCPCGKCARRLRAAGIEFDEVRAAVTKRDRPEIEELSGQRFVPVLVHGDEVVHESHRIVEFVEWVSSSASGAGSAAEAAG